jgi:hypothetical protein
MTIFRGSATALKSLFNDSFSTRLLTAAVRSDRAMSMCISGNRLTFIKQFGES